MKLFKGLKEIEKKNLMKLIAMFPIKSCNNMNFVNTQIFKFSITV